MRASSAPRAGLAGLLCGLLAAVPTPASERPLPDGRALVETLIHRQRDREALLDTLSYDIVERREELASDGRVARVERKRYEVFHVAGRPLRRLVSENGKPLPPEKQAAEDQRVRALSAAIRSGQAVTERPGVRLSELLAHYDLGPVGREPGPHGPLLVYRIEKRADHAAPPPRWLRDLEGRLWIDEGDTELVRLELRNARSIRLALGVGASVSAAGFELRQAEVKPGLWLPRQLITYARGRRFPWRRFHVRRTLTWENFRDFEVTTQEQFDTP